MHRRRRRRRDADGGADRRVLGDGIGGSIRIRRGRDGRTVDDSQPQWRTTVSSLTHPATSRVTPIVIALSVSRSKLAPAATLTTSPVSASNTNRPSGVVGQRVCHALGGGVAVGGEGGDAAFVPAAAFSAMLWRQQSASVGAVTSNSSTSRSPQWRTTVSSLTHPATSPVTSDRDRALALPIEARTGRNAHLAGRDRSRTGHRRVRQAVGDPTSGGIAIGGEGGDADLRPAAAFSAMLFAAASVSVGAVTSNSSASLTVMV